MRVARTALIFVGLLSAACMAQDSQDPPGPALLFVNGNGGLTAAERQLIFDALGVAMDSTGTGFVDQSCGQPAGAVVSFSDWNGDGNTEVLVIYRQRLHLRDGRQFGVALHQGLCWYLSAQSRVSRRLRRTTTDHQPRLS